MKYYIILLIISAISLTTVLCFTYLPTENMQDGISDWIGTPHGMTGLNFEKCMKTKGSNMVQSNPPVCYLPNGASYQIDE